MQLVAYGAQDIYLTGNPQITFFKVVYRRHTNFSMESIEQTWAGTLAATGNSRAVATISRNGDLVHKMFLEATGLDMQTSNMGATLVESVEVEIGGQSIDKHYGQWMETWAELTQPNPTGTVGTGSSGVTVGTLYQNTTLMGGAGNGGTLANKKAFIPLMFWFCENPGLALPLIALQYHEVKVILQTGVGGTGSVTGADVKLWADYIYLDTDERRRFAQVSHEYLITQVQNQSFTAGSGAKTLTLNFNHPVKELVWTGTWDKATGLHSPLNQNDTYQLKLNGHDRFAARDRSYFTLSQILQYHTGFGGLSSGSTPKHSIAVYSFALRPEEHQPSGTCNFSRIDSAQLVTTSSSGSESPAEIYAVNYNVLRIMSGMGGLAYSN